MRDVGSLGESCLVSICDAVGIAATQTDKDKYGWDYYLELPEENIKGLPKDLQQSSIKCKIQVKSTDNTDRKNLIKVSNQLRLAKENLPCFYLFYEFDGEDTPQRAYLVHVDKDIIERTLKRVRKLYVIGKNTELHKYRMAIKYDKNKQIKTVKGKDLIEAIKEHIPEGMDKYALKKAKLLDTLGFEDGNIIGNLTVRTDNTVEDLIDLSLGLKNELPVSKFEGFHKRFNFISKTPFITSNDGKLEIPNIKPVSNGYAIFKKTDFEHGLKIPVELFSSPFNSRNGKTKLLIKSSYFTLTINVPKNTMQFNMMGFDSNETLSLTDLKIKFDIIDILGIKDSVIQFEGLESNGITLIKGEHFNTKIEDVSQDKYLIDTCFKICSEVQIRQEEIHTSLDELYKYAQQSEEIHFLQNHSVKEIKIGFSYNNSTLASRRFCFVKRYETKIGKFNIGYLLLIIGDPKQIKRNEYILSSSEYRLSTPIIYEDKDNISLELFNRVYAEIVKTNTSSNIITAKSPEDFNK